MSVNKFGKYREVDSRYYNVPYKYITSFKGQHETPKAFRTMTLKEWKDEYKSFYEEIYGREYTDKELKEIYKGCLKDNEFGIIETKKSMELIKNKDKTLCIVDFFGKSKALVGWRNNDRCTISMPKLCPIVKKGKEYYILYKGRKIIISNTSGWVL